MDICTEDMETCKMAIAIAVAESKLGTHYVLPEVEKYYHNATGVKSKEILTTHKPDENGSWLRRFGSWQEHFRYMISMLRTGYFDKKCKTAECIVKYYVGWQSPRWVKVVNDVIEQLK